MTVREPRGKTGQPAAVSGGADIPEDPQALTEDIIRTRQQVGDTVEALATKLDPKAQLRDTVARMKGRASAARYRASAAAGEATGKITDKAGAAAQQLRGTAAKAARGTGERRVPLAVAAGVSALLAGAWIIWVVRRR
jgi:hypothetical protein